MWQVSPELSWFSWLAASTEAALALLSCLLWPGLLPEEADSTLISEASCLEEFEFLELSNEEDGVLNLIPQNNKSMSSVPATE